MYESRLYWLIVLLAALPLQGSETLTWRQVVVYEGKDKNGEDLFAYETARLEEFCESIKRSNDNRSRESLRRVHELQVLVFPFSRPLNLRQIRKIALELPAMMNGQPIAKHGCMNKDLIEPSQQRIKEISIKYSRFK